MLIDSAERAKVSAIIPLNRIPQKFTESAGFRIQFIMTEPNPFVPVMKLVVRVSITPPHVAVVAVGPSPGARIGSRSDFAFKNSDIIVNALGNLTPVVSAAAA